MNKIKINTDGRILNGEYKGWRIFIQNDKENTGGYLILISSGDIGYDDWVENYEDLKQYFLEWNKWEIKWSKYKIDC